ncbi:MAG: EAL domain-containing protein [Woeseiaceae bacterium]|nr:EAL domain-containing protein [Woeseiaceae bacterium]
MTERSVSKAGRLLHSLVPRAQVFSYYDHNRQCAWNSDGAEDYEIDNFVADFPPEVIAKLHENDTSLRRTLSSGRTVLALPVPGENNETAGLLVAMFSKNDGKSSSFNPGMLKNILEPAIELIGESLRVGNDMRTLIRAIEDVRTELEFVYEVDEKIHGTSARHSSLAQLVGRSGRYLGINYSVLLIPSKRIRISATHTSWKDVNRKVLDRYLIDQLMPKLEGQRRPVIFEIPAADSPGSAEAGYQALLCPLLDKQGNVEGILAQLGRVDLRKFNKNDRRFMSHIGRKVEYVVEQSFDSMTGLMSRAGFEEQLIESFGTLTSDSDRHQIIYFDLDNLQLVNDTFSRKAGDEVIMRFAGLLAEDLPNSAVLSRLTGDNFCMLLTHASTDAALNYANGVRKRASALRYLEGDRSLQVTMSIGIAAIDRNSGEDGNALMTARMACEAAKEHGRDRIEVYDEGNRSVVRRYDDMQLVAEIQQALDSNEFELLAQPIKCLTGKSSNPRFEVLLRMDDGEGGRIQSGAFFSAAERYRMMPQIDRWVVSTTIAKLTEVREFVEGQNAVFAMNLSGQSLGDDDFLEFIEQEIDNSKLPASSLCFEITESAAVSNLQKAQGFIDRLRERGCQISLDDFGAGLSSFAYLKNFNVDTLKIDGGFIRDITDNRISESMVAAITQVAKVMELKTVAEYVESEETRGLISNLGVDFAQGHLIGKPITLDSVLADLALINSK